MTDPRRLRINARYLRDFAHHDFEAPEAVAMDRTVYAQCAEMAEALEGLAERLEKTE